MKALRPLTYAALLVMIKTVSLWFGSVGVKGRYGGKAYVIKAAVRVWKNRATLQSALERKLPMRLQRARRPRKREQTAKKRPMRTKANMKRVR